MPERKDETGNKYGRLTVLEYVSHGNWRCKCDCGTIVTPRGDALRQGRATSCGCYMREYARKRRQDAALTEEQLEIRATQPRKCSCCGLIRKPEEFHNSRVCQCKWCKADYARGRNGSTRRSESLRFRYGMSLEEYDKRLESQGGVCAICGKGPNMGREYLSVDHCHSSNKVRGLLCGKCNAGLGYFGDNIGVMLLAKDYLIKHLTIP